MPYELPCLCCGRTLTLPEVAVGTRAECPDCGAFRLVQASVGDIAVATDSALPGHESRGASPYASKPGGDEKNSYASLKESRDPNELSAKARGNQAVSFGDVWDYAWSIYASNAIPLVFAFATIILLSLAIVFSLTDGTRNHWGVQLAIFIVSTYLGIGLNCFLLKSARREAARLTDFFPGIVKLLTVLSLFLVASIVLGLVSLIPWFAGMSLPNEFRLMGIVFFSILTGVPFALYFWSAYYFVVDGGEPIQSLDAAATTSSGNLFTIFLLLLVTAGLLIAGAIALGIGIIFVAPLVNLLWVTAYLMMSGQIPTRTAVPARLH